MRAACRETWSNGQTEGQVHKLKLLKRSMYGRAKFDLLPTPPPERRMTHLASPKVREIFWHRPLLVERRRLPGCWGMYLPSWVPCSSALLTTSSNEAVHELGKLALASCPIQALRSSVESVRTCEIFTHDGLGRMLARQLPRERIPSPLRLARDRTGDDGPAARVEEIVADDDDWTDAALLVPANGLEIGPIDLAPQDVGHGASATRISSARARSSSGSSFASSANSEC